MQHWHRLGFVRILIVIQEIQDPHAGWEPPLAYQFLAGFDRERVYQLPVGRIQVPRLRYGRGLLRNALGNPFGKTFDGRGVAPPVAKRTEQAGHFRVVVGPVSVAEERAADLVVAVLREFAHGVEQECARLGGMPEKGAGKTIGLVRVARRVIVAELQEQRSHRALAVHPIQFVVLFAFCQEPFDRGQVLPYVGRLPRAQVHLRIFLAQGLHHLRGLEDALLVDHPHETRVANQQQAPAGIVLLQQPGIPFELEIVEFAITQLGVISRALLREREFHVARTARPRQPELVELRETGSIVADGR